jgi:outer membrane lipoprotein carrier protein
MKSRTPVTLFALLMLAGMGHSPARAEGAATTAAASQLSASQVVSAVQAFYDQTRSIEAEFFQTYFNQLYQKYDRSNGTLKIAKPGRMRWDYAGPNGKVIVSDGKKLLVYEPGEDKDPGQVLERKIAESDLSALAFLTGQGKLTDDFSYRLLDAAAQGFQGGYVLELTPKKASPNYERILFYVDGDAKRAGLVHRVLIVDAAGNRNRLDFKGVKFNRAIDAKTFTWQPPKDARRLGE